MLAQNNDPGVTGPANTELEIVTWTADGFATFLGFLGTGTVNAFFTLYVKKPTDPSEIPYYKAMGAMVSPSVYVADRIEKFPQGTVVRLVAEHTDTSKDATFYGTILGGSN